MRLRWSVYGGAAGLSVAATITVMIQGASGSGHPPVNLNSPLPPADVSYPASADGDPLKMLPYFDDYSWRTFIAMVWPAASRGAPDMRQTVASNGTPKVFDSIKSGWEVFHTDSQGNFIGGRPAAWNVYEDPKFNACGQKIQFGDLVLSSFSKFSDVVQAGPGTLDQWLCHGRCGPLMASNRTYIHYLTGFNQATFNILSNWLGRVPLRWPVDFASQVQPGRSALVVKSAWMDMSGFTKAQVARYYTRPAWVTGLDSPQGNCRQLTMGLVGLHIVQRTLSRTQWIWSSFEQVDNVPPSDSLDSDGTFAFYKKGAPDLPLTANPYPIGVSPAATVSFRNVRRLHPISPSTHETNLDYRRKLQSAGSVWQYYQLVLTQFPIPHQPGVEPALPQNTFPGSKYGQTSFANVTMETFHQDDVANHSCLGCHQVAGSRSDFVWSVYTRTTNLVHGTMDDPALTKLKQLLSQ